MQQTLPTTRPPGRLRSFRRQLWAARWCYLFLLPGFVLLVLFSVYPLIASFVYSLFNWNGSGPLTEFIGLGNYGKLLHDSYFWAALGRTAWFAGVATPVEMAVSLFVAVLLNERALRLGPIFRTFFFIPVVTTTAVMSVVMSFVFSAYGSPVNQVLQDLHLIRTPIDFLGNPKAVMWTAIGIFVWKWMGQPMIYWLAGLQTIPEDLYEAARVDGATAWQQARYITAPLLQPFGVIITLIVVVGNMQVFAFLQALTHGGPYFASETMELYIYRTAFGASTGGGYTQTRLGYASAAGVLFGVLMMVLAGAQILSVRRMRRGPAGALR